MPVQFHTFYEMADFFAENAPHALVQDWWSRLEATIREICVRHGADCRENISRLIDTYLSRHPAALPELIRELHVMRDLRNRCAHGQVPSLTADEARAFAHRAWIIAWDLATKDEKLPSDVGNNVGGSRAAP